MAQRVFSDRTEAGRLLAEDLAATQGCADGIVLALPRGGVPVAFEVAQRLGLPLDLMLVRKLGVPGQEELAMGAIASGDSIVFNEALLRQLSIPEQAIQRTMRKERAELERRERLYRGERAYPNLQGRCVILVDDGLATGATMRAAIAAVRQHGPRRVVVAVPVAPPDTVSALEEESDEVRALSVPALFYGVGRWYDNFEQTSDDEVRRLLAVAWRQEPGAPAPRPPEASGRDAARRS